MKINKNYEPQNIEKKWYQNSIEKGYFTPKIEKNKKPFTIIIPPPNVTGILHMGHVLNNTLQDVMIRYKRMTGFPTLWIPGVDHAGIATQNVVEKQLANKGKTRHDIGRKALVEKIWQWKKEKGGRIIEQLKQLGCSCDWTRERFTMDKGLSEAVKEVFVQLYKKGLIYRGKRIINWCPRCYTALANDEVEYADEKGHLWNIRYPIKGEDRFVTVATTRPETMLGDTAVAVHPEDKRYQDLIGKKVNLPFVDRDIPIIADEYVDKEFGSGCVKITPAHDPNDFEVGERHDLEKVVVMDENAVMNENAGKDFAGMDRFECRKAIVQKLKEQELLGEIEPHEHSVGHCYRCETVIEPYLSDQWFVKMKPLAKRAIEVVKNGEIQFEPKRWIKVYLHWMENIRDWCISRQIWWGHRIPAYFCDECGELIVAKEKPEKCPKCGNANLRQEEDVLDTWFSSWLWAFSTMGWPKNTADLQYFLPTDLLITAPGIIYLWVARMIMATLEFMDKIPFKTVLLHGMVLDENGVKMSKSLGNSPDPIHIIEEYGADALRFSMIYNTPKGSDSYYSEKILETGRNFGNKIWNAFRFIMMNLEENEKFPVKILKKEIPQEQLELADKWIYSRLHRVIQASKIYYENLRFNDAANILMDFIWKEFCSWYLELAKDRIYSENEMAKTTAKFILLDVMQKAMRMLHPLMPFLSEEVWSQIKPILDLPDESLVIASYPKYQAEFLDENIEKNMGLIQAAISAIRNLRKQVNLPPSKEITVHIKVLAEKQNSLLNDYKNYFEKLAKVVEIKSAIDLKKPASSIAAVVQNIEIYLPLEGLIDIEEEKTKLQKQIEKLEKELHKISRKLENPKFLANAPENIVQKEKEKFTEVKTKLDKTNNILADL